VAQDLNPLVLYSLLALGLGAFVWYFLTALQFQDTTVEAVELAPDQIEIPELEALLLVGDECNARLPLLRELAVAHFEADPTSEAISPAAVFHLGNTDLSRAQFDEYKAAFERFLALTRKYKLALPVRVQRSITKIYFTWDPSGIAIQVKQGDRLWKTEIRPHVEELLTATRGGAHS